MFTERIIVKNVSFVFASLTKSSVLIGCLDIHVS